MLVNEVYGGKFLKAADIPQGRSVILTIAVATLQPMDDGKPKIALQFTKGDKQLLLNKTNAGIVAAVYGPSTDGWPGKKIEIYSGMTTFNGAPTPGLMVRVPQQAPPSSPPTPQQPAAAHAAGSIENLEDDLPY